MVFVDNEGICRVDAEAVIVGVAVDPPPHFLKEL